MRRRRRRLVQRALHRIATERRVKL
jgi:hypothetical protein